MGKFDFLFGNKKEKERLEQERQERRERIRLEEEKKIAEERERRLAENQKKEAERLAKIEAENGKKYKILDFYLNCSHCHEQEAKLRETPLALPIHRVDVEKEEYIVQKYRVNHLPKLILVDLNGKEFTRWEGITEPSEINDYLYNNGYAERSSNLINNDQPIEKEDSFKQFDEKLASQFVVESMSELSYSPYSTFSDDFAISEFQKQYVHYCLMAKSNLSMDVIGQSNPFFIALKKHIKAYISNPLNKSNQAMKFLYEADDMKILVQQVSMLSMHANMKGVQNIESISRQEFHNALDPEQVALAMGLYTYFTILVNKNFTVNDFNELFVESWINYYENVQARLFLFKMRGNNWKDDFKGVLLDD